MIDLHVHTDASDGRLSADEVLCRAGRRGVRVLVFTDHSVVTFAGLASVAHGYGVELPFPGTEVSTVHKGWRHHLVVYGPGVLDAGFRDVIQAPNHRKSLVMTEVLRRLADAGTPVPPPSTSRAYPSRTDVARGLAAAAGIPLEQAYDHVVRLYREVDEAETSTSRYLPTLEVLAAAERIGAVCGLAHALWRCADDDDVVRLTEQLPELVEHGLWGIATRSYHHRPLDDHPVLTQAARRIGLVRLGGSDFHGNGKSELGDDPTDDEAFRALTAAIGDRAPLETARRTR